MLLELQKNMVISNAPREFRFLRNDKLCAKLYSQQKSAEFSALSIL